MTGKLCLRPPWVDTGQVDRQHASAREISTDRVLIFDLHHDDWSPIRGQPGPHVVHEGVQPAGHFALPDGVVGSARLFVTFNG